MGRIITVLSGKGGVGKSTFSANVAVCLSDRDKKTLLIDADINLGNLDIFLGMQDKAIFNAEDIMKNRCAREKAIITHPRHAKLDFLPGAMTPETDTTEIMGFIASLAHEFENEYDYVIFDCPSGIDEPVRLLMTRGVSAVIVTTPDFPAIRDAGKTANILYGRNVGDVRLAVNRIRPSLIKKGLAPDIDDIIDRTEVRLLGLIPEDTRIPVYSNMNMLSSETPRSRSGKAFRNIAGRIDGEEISLYKFWK